MANVDSERTVLVVDDEDITRDAISRVIETLENVRCVVAIDAEDATDKFSQHDIDLLVTDLNMPGETGLEILVRLRNSGSKIPVIIFSGSLVEGEEEKAKFLGANMVLSKPNGMPVLRNAVQELLAGSA